MDFNKRGIEEGGMPARRKGVRFSSYLKALPWTGLGIYGVGASVFPEYFGIQALKLIVHEFFHI